ncbi:MAG TPA: sigma-70 family RNA polymerase sigma factor [Flavipsychrobacter sp.]|nr:sigma-70 family RNA polymerase sigma factor [Flavipsychrobacter sp.]
MMQTTTSITDAELLEAYLQGEAAAIESLIYRHKDKLYTSIYLLVKDKYAAEDIFQDTFLKIIRTINDGRYNEQGKFLPWALRVAHNLCMDHFRKERKQIPITTQNGEDILSFFNMGDEKPSSQMETLQTNNNVRLLIEELPEEQREVVVLRIYGDLSFKEIAKITGVSINTALGRMRYALLNLRKSIKEKKMMLR